MNLLYNFMFVVLLYSSLSIALEGRKEVEIKSIVSSIFDKPYDSQYSPPTQQENPANNSTSSCQLTVVCLSVENFRVLGLLPTSELLFAADIVAEYVDQRLSYEPREGIKYVDVQAYGGYAVWSPSLIFPHAPISNSASPEIILDDDSKYLPKVLVGPQGHIYRKFGIYRQLLPTENSITSHTNSSDAQGNEFFTLEIAEERNPISDVILRWKNTTNPIQLDNSQVTIRVPGGTTKTKTLTVSSGTKNDSCKRKENLGVFGDEEFSCVQVSFTLH